MVRSKSNIRIIGGKWRSRKVSFITKDTLRPTPDRVRETLFNWLAPHIVDAVCLDLYAGTGVLGIEALSRGAKSVMAVDKDSANVSMIEATAECLPALGHTTYNADCLQWLTQPRLQADVVFVDPPYSGNLLGKTFALLEENAWLKKGSFIYFELDHSLSPKLIPSAWNIFKQSKAGKVFYFLAKKEH